jgi:hypothetical protein
MPRKTKQDLLEEYDDLISEDCDLLLKMYETYPKEGGKKLRLDKNTAAWFKEFEKRASRLGKRLERRPCSRRMKGREDARGSRETLRDTLKGELEIREMSKKAKKSAMISTPVKGSSAKGRSKILEEIRKSGATVIRRKKPKKK